MININLKIDDKKEKKITQKIGNRSVKKEQCSIQKILKMRE